MPIPFVPPVQPAGALNPNIAANQPGSAVVARTTDLHPDVSQQVALVSGNLAASGGAPAPYYKQPIVVIGALIGTGAIIGIVSAVRSRRAAPKVAPAKKPA